MQRYPFHNNTQLPLSHCSASGTLADKLPGVYSDEGGTWKNVHITTIYPHLDV